MAFGTVSEDGQGRPGWKCSVDDITIPISMPINNIADNGHLLCDSSTLSAGQHSFSLSPFRNGTASTFWFDYFSYEPLPGDTIASPTVLRIQDDNPDVVYRGTWDALSFSNSGYGNFSISQTSSLDSLCSYTFNGEQVLSSMNVSGSLLSYRNIHIIIRPYFILRSLSNSKYSCLFH
jgi:hypothetical protein